MKRLAILVLVVLAGFTDTLTADAQSITTIHSFFGFDGAYPRGTLTLGPDGCLYGTAMAGGNTTGSYQFYNGVAFKITTNGLLTIVHNFNSYISNDGAGPWGSLTLGPDGNFYGTTSGGGATGNGTVYGVTTNGTIIMQASLNPSTGTIPLTGLALGPDGNFYGITEKGGNTNLNFGRGYGAVFKVTTNGNLTTLVTFDGVSGGHDVSPLILGPDNNFYGTFEMPFGAGYGSVFKVTTNGTLTTLVNFDNSGTNGFGPEAGVTVGPDGSLYGTTSQYGSGGTVFKVTTNGTLTFLASFGTNVTFPNNVTLGPDGNFYGTTERGGSADSGTVFKVTTNGTLTILGSFNGANGGLPLAGLALGPDGNFYGVANSGGSAGYGTVFRLNLPPEIVTPPANQIASSGGSASFSCQLFGTAPFSYQWLSNGVPIAGATNSILSFNPVVAGQAGSYSLAVSNAFGSVTSQSASLSVVRPKISAISRGGAGNITLSLASLPNSTNRLWMSTNLSLGQWNVIATNMTDTNGLTQFVDTNTVGLPQKFYRLSYP